MGVSAWWLIAVFVGGFVLAAVVRAFSRRRFPDGEPLRAPHEDISGAKVLGMRMTGLAAGFVTVMIASTAYAATPKLTILHLRDALRVEGYPARTQCGEVAEPPPPVGSPGRVIRLGSVPACWVIIERDGYSVSVIPHSSSAAAKASYKSMQNPWAKQNRSTAVGFVVISAFRLPNADWSRIYRVVRSVVPTSRR
jgi:hypothetical protein